MSRLVFLTCHLTGTGHLVRTLQLARAAQAIGHQATVITGGRVLKHLETHGVDVQQIPAVSVRAFEFNVLRMTDDAPVSTWYMRERLTRIRRVLEAAPPDAFITELFPFGRRMLADEFLGAIAAARAVNPKVVVLSSVRDIPEPKPRRLTEAATRLLKYYQGVLVHGDAAFLPLATTWPLPDDLAPFIHHVGYISREVSAAGAPPGETVLVSSGGGALGRRLTRIAAAAAGLGSRPWHVLVGGADAAELVAELADGAPANLTVETARADFPALLATAACSVSLCGYNTAVELARTTTPAILVPSEEAEETEQLIRAERMADFPGVALLRDAELTPAHLAKAAEHAANGPRRAPLPLHGDDGTKAVHTIERLLAAT